MSSRDNVSLLLGITVGSLLYVILNFIPLIGPFLAGMTAGKISSDGLKRGFLVGIFSGLFGSLLIFFIFYNWLYFWNILGKFLVGSLLLTWNLLGILLTTLGGIVGATFFSPRRKNFFDLLDFKEEVHEKDTERKILVICPRCKAANPKGRKYCQSCGQKL